MTAVATCVVITPIPANFVRWEELLGLIRTSFFYMDGVIDPPSSARRLTPEALSAKAAAETCFIAEVDGELAGCAFLAERADHFYLGKLAVLPRHQGEGIGRALLRAAEAHAIRAGKPAIELQTRVELTDNHGFFAARGFVETCRTAHEGYDRPTSLTMRKVLV